MPRRSLASLFVLIALGCGPSTTDDAGETRSDDDSSGTTEPTATSIDADSGTAASTTGVETSAADTSDTGLVDCNTLSGDQCGRYKHCEIVAGSEATPLETPGEYQCSDLGFSFACAPAGCEPYFGVICSTADPEHAWWIIERCIPVGFEACGQCI